MEEKRIWLSSPHMGGNEMTYVQNAYNANWIAPIGHNVDGFEDDLEGYLGGGRKVACLASGTSSLHLALILAGIQQDDEVICQSFTFAASANPIKYLGATPVFVDSENETWNLCPVLLEEAIKDRIAQGIKPKAIIVVHLYGMPAKIDEICLIAAKYDIILIEDAAEALGSAYKKQKCGTFGDFGILSFNGNKIITTSGGGALVCKTDEIKQKAIFYATQARDEAPHYQHTKVGYNYRMSNILAGIGRGQMEVLDRNIQRRREINRFYQSLFQDVSGITVFIEPAADFLSNHWLSSILVDQKITGFTREALRLYLESKNIESRPLWKPLHLQPAFQDCPFYGDSVSEGLFANGLCLPSGSNLNKSDRVRIKTEIRQMLG